MFYQLEGGELSRLDEQMFIQQEGRKEGRMFDVVQSLARKDV
jgi:hypothetical protein